MARNKSKLFFLHSLPSLLFIVFRLSHGFRSSRRGEKKSMSKHLLPRSTCAFSMNLCQHPLHIISCRQVWCASKTKQPTQHTHSLSFYLSSALTDRIWAHSPEPLAYRDHVWAFSFSIRRHLREKRKKPFVPPVLEKSWGEKKCIIPFNESLLHPLAAKTKENGRLRHWFPLHSFQLLGVAIRDAPWHPPDSPL